MVPWVPCTCNNTGVYMWMLHRCACRHIIPCLVSHWSHTSIMVVCTCRSKRHPPPHHCTPFFRVEGSCHAAHTRAHTRMPALKVGHQLQCSAWLPRTHAQEIHTKPNRKQCRTGYHTPTPSSTSIWPTARNQAGESAGTTCPLQGAQGCHTQQVFCHRYMVHRSGKHTCQIPRAWVHACTFVLQQELTVQVAWRHWRQQATVFTTCGASLQLLPCLDA